MADMLKALPFLTVDEYLWGHSAAFIQLMACDQSRVRYLSQKEIEERQKERELEKMRVKSPESLFARLGISNSDNAPKADWKELVRQAQEERNKNQQKQ